MCWAVYEGLRYTWEKGYRQVVLDVDSALVAHWLSSGEECSNHYFNLIQDCRDLLSRAWKVSVQHTFREGNHTADNLANLAL